MDSGAIKALAAGFGFDLAGLVNAGEFETLPDWVRTVLVLGQATLDESFDYEVYIAYGGHRRWSKPIYSLLMAQSSALSFQLLDLGIQSRPLFFTDSIKLIDLKKAAVLAGLGVLGENNLVINERFGPRVRFGCVFLGVELQPDRPLKDYYCASCSLCWGRCPTYALGPGRFVRARCIAEFAPSREMAELQKRLLRFPTTCTRLQCIECVTCCPVGKRLEREFFFDTT